MLDLHGIAHGIYVESRCLHAIVHHNGALDAQLDASFLCQMALGDNADSEQHHIGHDRIFARHMSDHTAIDLFKTRHVGTKSQVNAMLAHFRVKQRCHIVIHVVH